MVGNKEVDSKLDGAVFLNEKLYGFIARLVRSHVLEFGVKGRKPARRGSYRKGFV